MADGSLQILQTPEMMIDQELQPEYFLFIIWFDLPFYIVATIFCLMVQILN
jgi:hypothetical protein